MAKAMVTPGFPIGYHPYSVPKMNAQKEDIDVHCAIAYVIFSKFQMHTFAI